jgi:hypothetical protein
MLRRALAEQEEELRKLDEPLAGLRPLQQRRENIFTLVSQMRFNLGMEPHRAPEKPQPQQSPEDTARSGREIRPIWVVAEEVLAKAKRPMNTGELTEILRSLGYTQLAGRSGKDQSRSVYGSTTFRSRRYRCAAVWSF